jgi:predicted AlkP superfamily phosphohydrolase/phosphomutase
VYAETRGVPPDLMVYFGDLRWRAAGSVGSGQIYSEASDIGPDDANHDWNGVFLLRDGERDLGGQRLDGLQLIDMASTILERAGVEAPRGLGGRAVETRPTTEWS